MRAPLAGAVPTRKPMGRGYVTSQQPTLPYVGPRAGRTSAVAPTPVHRRGPACPWARERDVRPSSGRSGRGVDHLGAKEKWVMLRKARRFLFRSVPSATLWKREASIRLDQISMVCLGGRLVRRLGSHTQMPTRTKASPGERTP